MRSATNDEGQDRPISPDDCWTAFFREYRKLVFHESVKILGYSALAEEITQEVFVAVFKGARPESRTHIDWLRWLSRLARNKARSRQASEARLKAREYRVADRRREACVDPDDSQAILDDSQAILLPALSKLEPHLEEVVRLKHLVGLTYKDIALLVGRPEGTVKTQVRNGLKALGQLLKPHAELV